MSAVSAAEATSKSAAKKKKKSKKKPNGSAQAGGPSTGANGSQTEAVAGEDEDEEADDAAKNNTSVNEPGNTAENPPSPRAELKTARTSQLENGIDQHEVSDARSDTGKDDEDNEEDEEEEEPSALSEPARSSETSARLDAMQQERDKLRAEVTELRKSLEGLQEKHNGELQSVQEELELTNKSKEQAETQYRNLLGKVNTIRSQLGERLKEDAAELELAREKIEELETAASAANKEKTKLQDSISKLNSDMATQASEIESLRSRTSLSTSNWARERDDLVSREAYLREEYDVAKQAMQDWEILATEERSRRETMEERVHELEDQLSSQREAYDRLRDESGTQSSTVDGLQRALRDLQDERRRELREMVEQTQSQLDTLRAQTTAAEASTAALRAQLESSQQEVERTAPFEKEVKEKNLLIGKLRHEAVILNDHLTKALRFLKRGKPEDNVDRQLVTNHFLRFLQLDRSDPKKFQILQLIAALLAWDEQQREQAGLLRQGGGVSAGGGGGGVLRVPVSPFRRTPSTPALSTDFFPDASASSSALSPAPGGVGGDGGKDSLAELWSAFLEREAEAGSTAGSSRHGSLARGAGGLRSPSLASQGGMMSPPLAPAPAGRQNSQADARR